jgi:hypothetical protein
MWMLGADDMPEEVLDFVRRALDESRPSAPDR